MVLGLGGTRGQGKTAGKRRFGRSEVAEVLDVGAKFKQERPSHFYARRAQSASSV